MAGSRKKSWNEKLADHKDLPKVVRLTGTQVKKWGGQTMAIASPSEVDELIRTVPAGKVITISGLRHRIAERHSADTGCPITTGIFTWIAAHAAEERRATGDKDITPWWRVLKGEGFLNEKFPGNIDLQKKLLEAEGHRVMPAGKKWKVADLQQAEIS